MIKKITPSKISGEIKAPSSKSYMQRAVAIAVLANGKTTIHNPSFCNDAMSAIAMAKELGAEIKINQEEVVITGPKTICGGNLNAGESGLGIRMFSPISALSNEHINITGEGSLKNRPVNMLEEPLKSLGAEISTNNSFLPIKIKGPLSGGKVKVDGSISSQFLSGLLIALPLAEKDSVVEVNSLQSKPYVDMTLEIIHHFGVSIENHNYENFIINGGQKYTAKDYMVEGDWSAAAFHLVAAAIAGDVSVSNLNLKSKQADIKIIDVIKLAGADVIFSKGNNKMVGSISVSKNKLKAFNFDATHCPDLFPPLVVLCAACEGKSEIKGVDRLKHKESDRATVLKDEMAKIGIQIEINGNIMIVNGGKIISGTIDSHNDHRIAMAAAVAALISNKGISIEGAEAINKSYPEFFDDLAVLTSKQ